MLVLTRRRGEAIQIGSDVTVRLVRIGPGKARLGIDAPREIRILRAELVDAEPPEDPDAQQSPKPQPA